ncbi:LOW QUALITY PROTEIN: sulfotransferase 6B1-like [Rhynchocyon petersi]
MYNMLPLKIKMKPCKIIYIVRNAKNTAVSLYHDYTDNLNPPCTDMWAVFLELFLGEDGVCGAQFDHGLSWEEHKNEKNNLIIVYAEMKKDLFKAIKEITTFLGVQVSDSEISKIAGKTSFAERKNNAARENHGLNHTICALISNGNLVFRKAVGDWINSFTSKMRAFDELFTEKMKYSDLARHSEDYS